MKRMMSSFSPGGADSASMSETKPHLYSRLASCSSSVSVVDIVEAPDVSRRVKRPILGFLRDSLNLSENIRRSAGGSSCRTGILSLAGGVLGCGRPGGTLPVKQESDTHPLEAGSEYPQKMAAQGPHGAR